MHLRVLNHDLSIFLDLHRTRIGLDFGGSVEGLQVDFSRDSHLICGSSLRQNTTEAPQKIQGQRSCRVYYSGYAPSCIMRSLLVVQAGIAGYG